MKNECLNNLYTYFDEVLHVNNDMPTVRQEIVPINKKRDVNEIIFVIN